ESTESDWGFDILRMLKHKNEEIRWGPAPASVGINDISFGGTLTGLAGLRQGLGLDVQVYSGVRYKHQWRGTSDDDVTFHPSGNTYYKITPSLTGTLTLNTDFSDAPLDKRRVNTSRFSLFEPETRQFFLQDAAAFDFGGRNFGENDENGTAFLS